MEKQNNNNAMALVAIVAVVAVVAVVTLLMSSGKAVTSAPAMIPMDMYSDTVDDIPEYIADVDVEENLVGDSIFASGIAACALKSRSDCFKYGYSAETCDGNYNDGTFAYYCAKKYFTQRRVPRS